MYNNGESNEILLKKTDLAKLVLHENWKLKTKFKRQKIEAIQEEKVLEFSKKEEVSDNDTKKPETKRPRDQGAKKP